ncbi:siderophore-interacting protein [Plantibacter sp. YIM 135249]|uniref:siderophore-interacting protein n=1 Tax=Plantibacter sp. YIM 135249 TaxID=3423918 RepID=UPI003D357FCE
MAFCEPARVVSARRLTPNMVRVQLEAVGDWRWFDDGRGDERIDLAFPFPGESVARIEYFNRPEYGRADDHDEHEHNDHSHDHGDDHEPDPEDSPPWRHYTVRSVADAGRSFTIDFVVHEGGLAAEWAMRAEPGHVLGVFVSGDSSSYYDAPSDAEWQLLVADATGLPGLGRIIEELPSGARVHAIVEVSTAADEQTFETVGDVQITWLHGSGLGLAPSALLSAVEALELPETPGYAWVACEAAVSRSIRRHLRTVRGLPRNRHHAIGYWTAGHTGHFEQS